MHAAGLVAAAAAADTLASLDLAVTASGRMFAPSRQRTNAAGSAVGKTEVGEVSVSGAVDGAVDGDAGAGAGVGVGAGAVVGAGADAACPLGCPCACPAVAPRDHPDLLLVGFRGHWYDVTRFLARHPGGPVLARFAGADATAAVEAWHARDVLANRRPVGRFADPLHSGSGQGHGALQSQGVPPAEGAGTHVSPAADGSLRRSKYSHGGALLQQRQGVSLARHSASKQGHGAPPEHGARTHFSPAADGSSRSLNAQDRAL
jgi:hypothetical protein